MTIVETDRKMKGIETLGTVGTIGWIAKKAGLM